MSDQERRNSGERDGIMDSGFSRERDTSNQMSDQDDSGGRDQEEIPGPSDIVETSSSKRTLAARKVSRGKRKEEAASPDAGEDDLLNVVRGLRIMLERLEKKVSADRAADVVEAVGDDQENESVEIHTQHSMSPRISVPSHVNSPQVIQRKWRGERPRTWNELQIIPYREPAYKADDTYERLISTSANPPCFLPEDGRFPFELFISFFSGPDPQQSEVRIRVQDTIIHPEYRETTMLIQSYSLRPGGKEREMDLGGNVPNSFERIVEDIGSIGSSLPTWNDISSYSLANMRVAPWRRFITIEALQEDSRDRYSTSVDALLRQHTWLSSRPRGFPPYSWESPINTRILGGSRIRMQFVYYDIINKEETATRGESVQDRLTGKPWSPGRLFGDKQGRRLRYSACTTIAQEDLIFGGFGDNGEHRKTLGKSPYWTTIMLGPKGLFSGSLGSSPYGHSPIDRFQAHPWKWFMNQHLEMVYHIALLVTSQWELIDSYLEELLDEGPTILHGDSYVELLFEDDAYSRSRKYFWILGCLHEFQSSLKITIENWRLFKERYSSQMSDVSISEQTIYIRAQTSHVPLLGQVEAQFMEMERISKGFSDMNTRVEALRDGLFNASSVVESRASTRLGVNVKYLTYVSIFYLPLAFCASLWAVPNILEHATRTPFIVTSIMVGFVTYMAVFNLESLATILARASDPIEEAIIRQMKKKGAEWIARADDPDGQSADQVPNPALDQLREKGAKWTRRGENLKPFGPQKDSKPSSWWIPIFAVTHIIPSTLTAMQRQAGKWWESKNAAKFSRTEFSNEMELGEAGEPNRTRSPRSSRTEEDHGEGSSLSSQSRAGLEEVGLPEDNSKDEGGPSNGDGRDIRGEQGHEP
ncbi:hypothetical protein VTL71DRAFT_2895 [Oculimacula yallundae]|uniref:Uncharacterized protein n=1 Tax=Oculimacula yallundae TaxID=86028 RepID=A0ABR4C6S1_9HELO